MPPVPGSNRRMRRLSRLVDVRHMLPVNVQLGGTVRPAEPEEYLLPFCNGGHLHPGPVPDRYVLVPQPECRAGVHGRIARLPLVVVKVDGEPFETFAFFSSLIISASA